MSENRSGFIFYESYFEAIFGSDDGDDDLSESDQIAILKAVVGFALKGVEPDLRGIKRRIFAIIKPQIELNNRRFENGKKGAEHGRKGGRPRKIRTQNNPTETPTKPQNNPIEERAGDRENTKPQNNPTETPTKPPMNKNMNKNMNNTNCSGSNNVSIGDDSRRYGLHANIAIDDYAYVQLRELMGDKNLVDYINRLSGWVRSNRPIPLGDAAAAISKWWSMDAAKIQKTMSAATTDTDRGDNNPNFAQRTILENELAEVMKRLGDDNL
jgi:hypothetical protein